jgi:hypothetical protein
MIPDEQAFLILTAKSNLDETMKKKLVGFAFVFLSVVIMSASAIVYESAQQTASQTIIDIASISLKSFELGNLEEGETKSYTKAELADLGEAIRVSTTKANVYLHLDSDIQVLSSLYTTYTLTIKFITVPSGSSHSVGETATTLTIANPDSGAIHLDATGTWAFDFELETTAKLVSSDQPATATIVVTAENA